MRVSTSTHSTTQCATLRRPGHGQRTSKPARHFLLLATPLSRQPISRAGGDHRHRSRSATGVERAASSQRFPNNVLFHGDDGAVLQLHCDAILHVDRFAVSVEHPHTAICTNHQGRAVFKRIPLLIRIFRLPRANECAPYRRTMRFKAIIPAQAPGTESRTASNRPRRKREPFHGVP